MPVWLEWFPLWLWLPAAVLLLWLACAAWLAPRATRLRVRAAWYRRSPPSGPRLRHLLSLALALLSASLLFAISAGETLAVRLAACGAAALTTWLAADSLWRAVRDAALRRAALHRDWDERTALALGELAAVSSEALLPEAACRILRERLGCSSATLFLAAEGGYRRLASCPAAREPADPWAETSVLVRELSSRAAGVPLLLSDPATGESLSWAGSPEVAPPAQARLDALGAVLAAPLFRGARLEGFFLLGALDSGEVYGPWHFAFLGQYAAAVALLRQSLAASARLSALAAGDARREARRAAVRLAMAALQPAEEIGLTDLDCTGILQNGSECRLFLDVVSLPGRAAAFVAVEMDSGFEEAAIRIVQLQALLRARVRAYHEDLAELIESTRRAMETPGAGWPAARLLLARYRSGTRRLHYINAGFPPPFLFRRTAEGAQALRLKHTGAPLDANAVFRCEEAEIELAPGDLLLAVSSSVPAAANAAGEAWGDARIIETLAGWRPSSAAALLEQAAGAWKQHLGPSAELPPHLFLLLRPKP